MNWHKEALAKNTQNAAHILENKKWLLDFYLAGGTALALYYGHRISVDLDFFTSTNPLLQSDRDLIIQDLSKDKVIEQETKDRALHILLADAHVSFLGYQYPLLEPLKKWGTILIAQPTDIALMKIAAIMGRGQKKDFVDLHRYLKEGTSLYDLLRLSEKKFKMSKDFPMQACQALIYFEDADLSPMPKMIDKTSWTDVKFFLELEVKRTAKLLL